MRTEKELSYPREEENMKCPICSEKEDTTEPVIQCQTTATVYRIKANTPNHWVEVVKVYR